MKRVVKVPKITIDPALLNAWQKLQRRGDAYKIAEITGKSAPTISKALKFGNCSKELSAVITKFLVDRKKAENKDISEMLNDLKS